MMKTRSILLGIGLSALLAGCTRQQTNLSHSVNPVIGDLSYLETFGHAPDAHTDEALRIKTHLAFVEELLRSRDVSTLNPERRAKRAQLLEHLRDYLNAGIFPVNFDYPGKDTRIPCFIDDDGRICAVGYLIEKTAGRQVAESINAQHRFDHLLAMNDPAVEEWVRNSGLTMEECAMIQPAYQPPPSAPAPSVPSNHISPSYGISSSLFSGVNLSLSLLNAQSMARGSANETIQYMGLFCGASQMLLGFTQYPAKQYDDLGNPIHTGRRNLSILNITLGTSTLFLSIVSEVWGHKPKPESVRFNLYAYPVTAGQTGLGFSITRRL